MDNLQDITNNTPSNSAPIDVSMAMTSGGVSDSVKMADAVLNSGYHSPLNETLSESLKRVSALSAASYSQILAETPEIKFGGGYGGGGGLTGAFGAKTPYGGNELFQGGNEESWNQEINLNDYYTKMSDDWNRLGENAGAIAIGGGIATGALTGAGIGSLAGPVGTLVGGIVGGILGGIEGNQVAGTVGAGYVRNKFGVNEDAHSKTGFWGGLGTASMKLTHSAMAVNLSLAGMVAYAPQAISQGSVNVLFNNNFSKLLDDYDKSSESSNRVYHSKDYQNASLLGSFAHSEMWIEKVSPGIGFMLGAMATGNGASLGLRGLGLTGTGTASASRAFLSSIPKAIVANEAKAVGLRTLQQGFKEAVKADLKAQTIKSLVGNTISTMVSAAPEAGIEARGAMNEAREDFAHYFQIANNRMATSEELENFEKDNVNTANAVFGTNLAILSASNWLQFGDLIGVDKIVKEGFFDSAVKNAFGLGIKRAGTKGVAELTEKGVEKTIWELGKRGAGKKIGYGVYNALANPVTEGWEEGMQSIISGTQKNYLESRFNPQANEANKSLMSSVGQSFAHTMTSREGWEEMLIGMLIGAGGSARVKGGPDILNIRQSMRAGAEAQANVDNLNATSAAFTTAQEDYLDKQGSYNKLNNNYIARLNDRIGASNQQMYNSDKSKEHMAKGELELAGTTYQNALFAKLAAERRAGITEGSKFDVDMLIDNTPDETLKEMHGFKTQEDIDIFKEDTKKRLTDIHDSFEAAYDMAEVLNLGTGFKDFSPTQVTEMAALNFFHGMQSADNANSIARNLEGITGIAGVAGAMNHYSNLSGQNVERANKVKELKDSITELERKRVELMESFSQELTKPVRETENTTNVSNIDRVRAQMEANDVALQKLETERAAIQDILDSREEMPSLPFGNAATKFFDSVNIKFADTTTTQVLESLDSFDKYVSHLRDTTGKTAEEQSVDNNKAETIESMLGNYKSQMGLMRNFAKTAQMVSDPAYVNNMAKGIFNSKKYHEIFDNQDWVDNTQSGFDELSKAEFKELQARIKDGEISMYDVHTYMTNTELLRMGSKVIENEPEGSISQFDINRTVSTGEDGEKIFDSESEVGQRLFEITAQAVADGKTLTINESIVYKLKTEDIIARVEAIKAGKPETISNLVKAEHNTKINENERLRKIANEKIERVRAEIAEKYTISKLMSGEVPLPDGTTVETVGGTRMETEVVEAEDLKEGDKIIYGDKIREIKTLYKDLFGVNKMEFVDGDTVTKIEDGDWKIVRVTKEAKAAPEVTKKTTPVKSTIQGMEDFLTSIQTRTENGFLTIEGLKLQTFASLNVGDSIFIFDKGNSKRGVVTNKGTASNITIKLEDGSSFEIQPSFASTYKVEDIEAMMPVETTETIESPTETSDTDLTMDDVLNMIEAEQMRAVDKIRAEFQEAINPVQKENIDIKNALDQLNEVIEDIIDLVQSENREINVQDVNTFGKEAIPIKKEFNRIKALLDLKVRTAEQQTELDGLLDKVNSYGLIEGRIGSFNNQKIRLSDLLEQRSQLENELFETKKNLDLLSDIEMRMTFDTTVEEDEPFVKEGDRVGDAAVLNTYEFATFMKSGDNYQISNLTPQGFVGDLTRDKDFSMVVTDSENNIRDVDYEQSNWDGQVKSGDSVIVNIVNPVDNSMVSVSFKVDNSRRVLVPMADVQNIEAVSNLRFNVKNQIGKTAYNVLTRLNEGIETYLDSDFEVALDSDAIQKLTPGDDITFEYDADNQYNKTLKAEYDSLHPDENSTEATTGRMIKELVEQLKTNGKSKAMESANRAIYSQIKAMMPGDYKESVGGVNKAVATMLKNYEKQFDKKLQAEASKKFKANMFLVAKDKAGNRVGVVKALQNSNSRGKGRQQMDQLRSSIMDQLIANNFKNKTKTKYKVPVQIVYMGIPNIKSENGEKTTYQFSEEQGEFNIHPSKIKSIGYVTYGEITFSDKRKISTPYNYAKSIMENTTYQGRRIPVVSFMHNGKEVIYPITLADKNTEAPIELFNKILEKKDKVTVGEFIKEANDFLADNGVPTSYRLTSLNIAETLEDVTKAVEALPNITSLDEFMSPTDGKSILMESGIIDINLNDSPFVGPKVRFDLNAVPQSESSLLEETYAEPEGPVAKKIEEIINEENCTD